MAAVIWLSPLTLLPLLASLDPLDRGAPARWIVWLLAIVWTADSAAYLVGRTIGRRKLAPVLSPRKSLEGLVGGILVAGLVGALIAGPLFTLGTPEGEFFPWGLVWGLIIATAAEAGDLLESLFKRVAGAESASNLIPGHGGVLDRIDSLLLAAPVTLIAALLLRG
jgi:phosphatidate cytidylyltransferase